MGWEEPEQERMKALCAGQGAPPFAPVLPGSAGWRRSTGEGRACALSAMGGRIPAPRLSSTTRPLRIFAGTGRFRLRG
jgi:hypothetical protein